MEKDCFHRLESMVIRELQQQPDTGRQAEAAEGMGQGGGPQVGNDILLERASHPLRSSLGLSSSRSQSANRLIPTTSMTRAAPGKTIIHHIPA